MYCLKLLEGGILPIRFIIISERLGYLQVILKKENSSLVKQVLQKQLDEPHIKQDWIFQALDDLKQLELTLSFEDISQMSKYKFKKVVKKACHKAAFDYLLAMKEQLSKGSEICYGERDGIYAVMTTNRPVVLFAIFNIQTIHPIH